MLLLKGCSCCCLLPLSDVDEMMLGKAVAAEEDGAHFILFLIKLVEAPEATSTVDDSTSHLGCNAALVE